MSTHNPEQDLPLSEQDHPTNRLTLATEGPEPDLSEICSICGQRRGQHCAADWGCPLPVDEVPYFHPTNRFTPATPEPAQEAIDLARLTFYAPNFMASALVLNKALAALQSERDQFQKEASAISKAIPIYIEGIAKMAKERDELRRLYVDYQERSTEELQILGMTLTEAREKRTKAEAERDALKAELDKTGGVLDVSLAKSVALQKERDALQEIVLRLGGSGVDWKAERDALAKELEEARHPLIESKLTEFRDEVIENLQQQLAAEKAAVQLATSHMVEATQARLESEAHRERLRRELDHIGFYFAGDEKHHHVSERVLKALAQAPADALLSFAEKAYRLGYRAGSVAIYTADVAWRDSAIRRELEGGQA